MPKFNINGSDTSLYLGYEYVEQGYEASIFNIDLSNLVSIESNLDNTKVGTYEVKYILKYYLFKITKVRNVEVYESEAPIITLEGDTLYYVCPSSNYEEAGYKAYDNYDLDITSKVKVSVLNDTYIYEVEDSSHNKTKVERKIIYEDIKPPIITLEENKSIMVGESFIDAGYKAYDNCLGDITSEVKVTNNVDTSKVGHYKVYYEVSDGYNSTVMERDVFVYNKAILGTVNTPGVIYLTFDDGPSNNTKRLLDILDKYDVKVTFFVVPKISELRYLIKEEYERGHAIGIHSMSHNYSSIYTSDDALLNDIKMANEVVKEQTGSYTYLYRYPGGSSNTVSRSYSKGIITRTSSILHDMGYHYFDWNISSGDAGGTLSTSVVYNNVISHLSKSRSNVVLMHDTQGFSVDAVEDIIQYGISNGYTFAPLSLEVYEVHHGIAN